MAEQVLDSMDIERERGITIKAQSVTLYYDAHDGRRYQLNFIDTPGHVDFSYEVSRSLAACEGALLVVDAAQGVEAQSVANCYTAIESGAGSHSGAEQDGSAAAEPDKVATEIEEIIGIDASHALRVSAKTGLGIPELLEQIVAKVPAPQGDPERPLQALIIDSWFDNYLGVVSLVRVVHGRISQGRSNSGEVGRAHADRRWHRVFHAEANRPGRTGGGRSRLRHRRHQGHPTARRSATRSCLASHPAHRAASRFQRRQAAGVCGAVSSEFRRLRRFPRGARQAAR